ncbi:hypothetical protein SARC_13949 [Sphaeroforma arctica JP610]|uniref:Uncharacterized protein n=1 Tax=Sphaeroforma arctica JP610 TaxID=667725 RepID=A0A0L0FBN2_9EUKA|nr:hypothetical protein SARC_13949 [Sphaeroforma arctica JP610]KNC73493.1 hypothetical protein SARC_13949 [Sphaeroforma arctica JP610]|eukprot:XP_014147395.1 hypothetical protein SARC_13949 [Sphaeroforma arctica JP610]
MLAPKTYMFLIDESEFRHFLDFIEPENLPIQYGGTSMFDFNKDFYGRFRVGFMPLGIEVDLTRVSLEDAMAGINKLDDTYMASG